jgi:peptidoglycan/xylan/chitin deacetylase (PgdA/CDA1 family)
VRVTLTFDNGPTPEATPRVLETLRRRGVPALFFVLGRHIADPPRRDLVAEAHADGHLIGNHTYFHKTQFGDMTAPMDAVAEITRTQDLIAEMAGEERLFRPSGGGGVLNDRLLNPAAVRHLEAERYTLALWSSVPRDWEDPDGWVARALVDCDSRPWSVVVLHDLPTGAMTHLDRFLGSLLDRGAEFRQDFPIETTPILRGRRVGDLRSLTCAQPQGGQDRSGGGSVDTRDADLRG